MEKLSRYEKLSALSLSKYGNFYSMFFVFIFENIDFFRKLVEIRNISDEIFYKIGSYDFFPKRKIYLENITIYCIL